MRFLLSQMGWRLCAFVATSFFGVACTHAQYTVTLLHPSGLPSGTQSWAAAAAGGMQGGVCGTQAFLWDGSANNYVALGTVASEVDGMSGDTQVGYQGLSGSHLDHATLWHGTAASAVDLNPAGMDLSFALGVSANTQTGYANVLYSPLHAFLWHGTAASAVDLHPAGFYSTFARAVDGATEVGSGYGNGTGNYNHALMWSGTAGSVVDLHPAGWVASDAYGVSGNTQVGTALQNVNVACLWHGTPGSFVQLGANNGGSSAAFAALGDVQVGYDFISGYGHAVLWRGSLSSRVDLHPFVTGLILDGQPLNLVESVARGIDSDGNIVGYGVDQVGINGKTYAIMWKPVRTIAGTVNLQSYSAGAIAGTQVTIEIRSPGSTTPLDSHVVALDSGGNFSFVTTVPAGAYDITAKPSHWLRQRLSNQTVGTFGVSGLSFSVVNGDVNGDNVVSLADFGALRAAFGSSSGGNNWNPNADLNGDGTVSLADFGILRASFGRQGDP